jgi:hypothetical protein
LERPVPEATVDEQVDEQAIGRIREALNRAVDERNTAPFAKVWLPDVHITSGSGEVLSNDRTKHVKRFVAMFADPSFAGGRREPTSIEVSDDGMRAAEHGEWTWRFRHADGLQDSQGTYLVMWRKAGGEWRIQSELYIMLRCPLHALTRE